MAPVLERKAIGADQTNSAKRRATDLIWRTKNQATKVHSNSLVGITAPKL